ncbi:hypothetical protein N0V85_004946 [Neurospora sp. IMI 360204]|nr:hypothetical protein N0V85_004946 [Neurospora sp. IMI 360204]
MPRADPLRHPPPAYVFDHPTNPVVESWLDTLPPLAKEPCRWDIKQWRRARGGESSGHRTWFIFSIIIRAISTVVAIIAWSLNVAVFVESRLYRGGVPGRMIAVLVMVGLPSFLARSSHSTVLLLHSFLFFNYFCHKLDRHDPGPFVKMTGLPLGDLEAATLEGGSPKTQHEPPFRYKSYEYYAKEDMEITRVGQRPDGGFIIDKGVEDMEQTVGASTTIAARQSEDQIRQDIGCIVME